MCRGHSREIVTQRQTGEKSVIGELFERRSVALKRIIRFNDYLLGSAAVNLNETYQKNLCQNGMNHWANRTETVVAAH